MKSTNFSRIEGVRTETLQVTACAESNNLQKYINAVDMMDIMDIISLGNRKVGRHSSRLIGMLYVVF